MERICGFLMLVSYLLISSTHTEGFEIRLAGYGSTRCSGRVEIFHNNSWGTVCDDDWDIQDVKVVCRQLGCGAAVRATKSAHFGLGTGRIWLDEVNCLGREKSLADCKHRKTGKHNCRHNEDAGVVCASVRLSGSTKCSGRVEVYYNNSWGTVCDDRWDLSDAMVVCRQLGCGMARGAALSALFGEGDKVIWLDEVNCSGNENSLTECQHKGFGEHDCSNREDAGVVCSDSLPKPSISVDPGAEVKLGQNVSITCSNSAVLSGGTYILKKTSLYSVTDRLTSISGTFRIPNVDFDDGGSYQCHYEKTISNQTFTTIPSDVVMLYMTGILPMPEISMDPANDVTLGQDVIISCATTTHIQQLGGLFSLVKTSDSVFEQEISTSNSTTFTIAKVTFDDEGRYQCVYKIGQSVSPPSNFCTLTITAPQSVAVFRIATAVLLLLLLLLVVVCLISWRKRRKTKQSGGLILSQLSTTAKNKCEDDKDHSYMNLDQRMINDELRDKGSGAEGKDTDVYEWPDEDHDYDEVGRDKNLINVSAGIENNRKDEKEENPYIDLTLDKLDIY